MRARDFIFEAVTRRGFLKGIGAATAAAKLYKPPPPPPPPVWKNSFEIVTRSGTEYNNSPWEEHQAIEWKIDGSWKVNDNLDITRIMWDSDSMYTESELHKSIKIYTNWKTPIKNISENMKDVEKLLPEILKSLGFSNVGSYSHYEVTDEYVILWQNESVGVHEEIVNYVKKKFPEWFKDKKQWEYADHWPEYAKPKKDKKQWADIDHWPDRPVPVSPAMSHFWTSTRGPFNRAFKGDTDPIENKLKKIIGPLFNRFVANTAQNLSASAIKHIIDGIFDATQTLSPEQGESDPDNVIDIKPHDVTVHDPVQALPSPQLALPPPSISDIEATFVQALGRDLTYEEKVLIKQEYNKKL